MKPLEGKVAIITGAGRLRGIGRAPAVALAADGADIVVTGTGRDPSTFPEDEKADFPQIPWDKIARVRDFYTHHYSRLNPERLRRTVEVSLRELLEELDRLGIPDFLDEAPEKPDRGSGVSS